ncbi:hypothetical protein AB434_3064 [Heyndrickxia coagulans]|uniref:Uncharacterized protein n=1 Tax=Heyndrickxia coagulans TaxID=1398 RepID=A0AAN0T607_HEYCO|nr:hypothetical protein SB48_HM08orf03522 [Heyndrickxia coagulans]AKN55469.1 hypothetical protein AB434_3064 [Heyndrickxia coagulans]KYC79163.1 hypothetical protein B4096_3230 [Heyndrickxia coagulans]
MRQNETAVPVCLIFLCAGQTKQDESGVFSWHAFCLFTK